MLNTNLNKSLRTVMAREHCYIKSRSFKSRKISTKVKNGIFFCMDYIRIFCILFIFSFSCPRKFIIRNSIRKSIITDAKNSIIRRYENCTNLRIRIFRSHCSKLSNSHIHLIFRNVIIAFARHI